MALKVFYLTGRPAEAQLSAPVIRRMKADPYFDVYVDNVLKADGVETRPDFAADVVVSPCDRIEMVIPTFAAFKLNAPIVRIYAGINTSGGTHDDVVRRMLDSMGHILLCESEECRLNLAAQGEEEWRTHTVGITHLDDVEIDYSLCPPWEYVLVLMNPVTISSTRTADEVATALHEAERALATHPERHTIIFPPNGDLHSDVINAIYDEFVDHWNRTGFTRWTRWPERIDRPKFLGLLSKCCEFISNSSATRYEFPAVNSSGEVFNPSWRNQERTKLPPLQPGGSQRIVDVLKSVNWEDKEKLLRKRFRY